MCTILVYGIDLSFLSSGSGAIFSSNNRFLFKGASKLGSNKNFHVYITEEKSFITNPRLPFVFSLKIRKGKSSLFSVCRNLCSESSSLPS